MAAFALQPHVSEFLDVVMHDETLEYRIEGVEVTTTSPLVGRSLADAALREGTGALLLAIRSATGQFIANPTGIYAWTPTRSSSPSGHQRNSTQYGTTSTRTERPHNSIRPAAPRSC
jgi:hypothetical protein